MQQQVADRYGQDVNNFLLDALDVIQYGKSPSHENVDSQFYEHI